MAKMLYYISEEFYNEGMSFANHLVKRCDSYEEAAAYLTEKKHEWANELLYVKNIRVDDELWGIQALDAECMVVHNYKIFATPIFMGGGAEGL